MKNTEKHGVDSKVPPQCIQLPVFGPLHLCMASVRAYVDTECRALKIILQYTIMGCQSQFKSVDHHPTTMH